MTLQQGIELAQMAKAKGYATRAENGRIQFVIMAPKPVTGVWKIEREISDWLGYAEAKALMQ